MKLRVLITVLALATLLCSCKGHTQSQEEQPNLGTLSEGRLKQLQNLGELDPRGVSFQNVEGASEMIRTLGLSTWEVSVIGAWNAEDDSGTVVIYPNGIVKYRRNRADHHLLGFVGLWKIENDRVKIKTVGYVYSEMLESDLTAQRNSEMDKYGKLLHSPNLSSYEKLFRFDVPNWADFFNLKDIDESNYTYRGFFFPSIPDSITGKADSNMPVQDVRRWRLTSDPVNPWTDVVKNKRFWKRVDENASEEELKWYFNL